MMWPTKGPLQEWPFKVQEKVSHAKGQGFELWAGIFQSEHSEISCSQIFTNNGKCKCSKWNNIRIHAEDKNK